MEREGFADALEGYVAATLCPNVWCALDDRSYRRQVMVQQVPQGRHPKLLRLLHYLRFQRLRRAMKT
jgi:hypothetical protein